MINVIMFDLGGTLGYDARRPFPHAADALAGIARLKTAKRKPVASFSSMPEAKRKQRPHGTKIIGCIPLTYACGRIGIVT
jgi:hypothetical protein